MRTILRLFIELTRPLIWRIAEAYDLRVNKHVRPQGQHPIILKGGHEEARRLIPKTAYFNTRSGSITIGENTVFGEDVMILTGKHYCIAEAETENLPLHFVPEAGRDISIGKGCYIGSRAILIGSLNVGDYAVIGAGAVVTKDVPARTFVAGVPAIRVKSL